MDKSKLFFVIVGLAISILLIISLFIFGQPKLSNSTGQRADNNEKTPNVDNVDVLDASAYQAELLGFLREFNNDQTSNLEIKLSNLLDKLSSMKVVREVKDDHLSLYIAFDSWRNQSNDQVVRTLAKNRLESFRDKYSTTGAELTKLIEHNL